MTDDQPDIQTLDRTEDDQTAGESGRPLSRILGLVLIIGSLVLATYLVVAAVAWFSGQGVLAGAGMGQYPEEITRQIELAQSDIDAASYSLALRRLEWVLEQEPQHSGARTMRTQVQQIQASTAATAAAAEASDVDDPVVSPTDEPEATSAVIRSEDVTPGLQSLRNLVARQEWDAALPALLAFRQDFPDYERLETDQMLYDTYLNLGLQSLEGEKVELGLNYLNQAEQLGDLTAEAQDFRTWAGLYLDGIAYFGVNWSIAETYFRDLCASAPFFQSSCLRLNEILLNQARQYTFAGEWCPAIGYYEELARSQGGADVQSALTEARENCALATPVPLTGTVGVTSTLPITATDGGE